MAAITITDGVLQTVEAPEAETDLDALASLSQGYGPKRVKTPNLEVEQFDPLTIQKAKNQTTLLPTFGSLTFAIATPKDKKCGCE